MAAKASRPPRRVASLATLDLLTSSQAAHFKTRSPTGRCARVFNLDLDLDLLETRGERGSVNRRLVLGNRRQLPCPPHLAQVRELGRHLGVTREGLYKERPTLTGVARVLRNRALAGLAPERGGSREVIDLH